MFDAFFSAILVQAFGDGFNGSGVDEVMGADGDGTGTGQHEFDGILPGRYAAQTEDGDGYGLSRLVETSIRDVDFGLVEAAESLGATPFQIIRKVLIPEALPTIINNITVLIVNLIGASAMAGAIGGGGLGDIAIRYGYQRFRPDVMLATIIILIVVVNVIQAGGDFASRKKNKK